MIHNLCPFKYSVTGDCVMGDDEPYDGIRKVTICMTSFYYFTFFSCQMEVTGVNSVLLQNLSSLSRYLVSVRSKFEQGLSAPVTANVTTCKTLLPSLVHYR